MSILRNLLIANSLGYAEFEGVPPLTVTSLAGNLANYKIYGNSRQSPLPQGFKQVEYIQSTSTQYFRTNIITTIDTKIRTKACSISAGNIGTVNLIQSGSGGNPFDITCFSTANAYGGRFGGSSTGGVVEYTAGVLHEFELYNGMFICDGVQYPMATVSQIQGGMPINMLGGVNNNAGWFKIEYCEIYQGDTLVLNAIPCVNIETNVVELYDTISKTFVEKVGEGNLIAGPDVNPTPSNPIQVESVGYYNLWNGVVSNFIYVDSTSRVSINTANYRSIVVPYETGQQITITRDVAIGNRFTGFFTKEYPVCEYNTDGNRITSLRNIGVVKFSVLNNII